jgi:signal transduction histidine kinase
LLEIAWGVFALANLVAMQLWESWETIPFHFIWVSLTLLYGFRTWRLSVTTAVLALVVASTGVLIMADAFEGEQLWGELFEVPLMSAMFVAMVWHARRRQEALAKVKRQAEERAELLERQEQFLHDVSHELRTRRPAAERSRANPGGRRSARRAWSDRADPPAVAPAREDRSSGLRRR